MRAQPAVHVLAPADTVLYLPQRAHPGFQRCRLLCRRLNRCCTFAQCCIQLGHPRHLGLKIGALFELPRLKFFLRHAQALELSVIRRRQSRLLIAQALLTRRQLRQYFPCVFAACVLELQFLRIVGGVLLRHIAGFQRVTVGLLGQRQASDFFTLRSAAQLGRCLRTLGFGMPIIQAGLLGFELRLTKLPLIAQVGQTRLNTMAVLPHVLDLLF